MRRPPFSGDQLDRPYGDQETDYVTIVPEIATPEGSEPTFDPVAQAGGGQAEGFEQSEALLVEHAEHAPEPELTADGFDLTDPGTDVDPDVADVVAKEPVRPRPRRRQPRPATRPRGAARHRRPGGGGRGAFLG